MSAVVASDVVLAYNGHVAVRESSFEIPSGALTAIIGPNGSGKSTLLNAMTGLARVVRGHISVRGGQPADAHHRVAHVLQATTVNEVMPVTVREVVAMGRYARLGMFGLFGARDREVCQAAMERLGVSEIAGSQLAELSAGQRQRVFVAQGLAQEADLLLLDEPVSGLDLGGRRHVAVAMRQQLEVGNTVVFTTHDLAEASESDHVILMAGRVVTQGSPETVLEPDLLSTAYGIGLVHLEDGTVVLDDAAHRTRPRHVHFERGDRGNPS